jgi:hypothetical protein
MSFVHARVEPQKELLFGNSFFILLQPQNKQRPGQLQFIKLLLPPGAQ